MRRISLQRSLSIVECYIVTVIHPSIQHYYESSLLHRRLLAQLLVTVVVDSVRDFRVFTREALALTGADGVETELLRVELAEVQPEDGTSDERDDRERAEQPREALQEHKSAEGIHFCRLDTCVLDVHGGQREIERGRDGAHEKRERHYGRLHTLRGLGVRVLVGDKRGEDP